MKTERKSIIAHEWDLAVGVITFTVAGAGQCQLNVGEIVGLEAYASLSDVGKAMVLHGGTQKVSDKAALSRNPDTGRSATPQDKLEAMAGLCDHLNNGGDWTMRAASKKRLDRAALFEALSEVTGRSAVEISQKFAAREDEVLRTFLERADIAAAYAKRTARDSGKADELLAELEG